MAGFLQGLFSKKDGILHAPLSRVLTNPDVRVELPADFPDVINTNNPARMVAAIKKAINAAK